MNRPSFSLFKRPQIIMGEWKRPETEPAALPKTSPTSSTSTPSVTSSAVEVVGNALQDLNLKFNDYVPEKAQSLPFLTFPGEIRNCIYRWAWLMSRERDEIYGIPDFQIHGDENGDQKGGIRWMNVPAFPLLLVSKQTRYEVMPIISAKSWFEIKTYVNQDNNCKDPNCPRHMRPDLSLRRAFNCLKMLELSRPLLQDAQKITIDLTPKFGEWMAGVMFIFREISKYKRLQELTAKALVRDSEPKKFLALSYLFALQKKNKSLTLCFELSDSEVPQWDRLHQKKRQNQFEKTIARGARKYGGEHAEVWVEWTIVREEDLDDIGFW